MNPNVIWSMVMFLNLPFALAQSTNESPLVVELWPGKVPDESAKLGPERIRMSPKLDRKQVEVTESTRMITDVSKPTITIHRPAENQNSGTAILICPGGGYWNLYWQLEGEEVAAWLNSIGITGIILKYRVPRRADEPEAEPARRPLQDAQRAVSLVRSKAAEWGINSNRIGIIGFSAGGHLAIATATSFDQRSYEAVDDVDKISCRPDFAVAAYSGYLKSKDKNELAPGLRIPIATPPMFLVHGGEDIISPPEHSVLMYLALKRAGVPAELHIYATTTHDFGVRTNDHPYATWTGSCLSWLRDQGFFKSEEPPSPTDTQRTILAISGTRFTLNSNPTFLYGISYYGALAASEDFIRRDLDDIQRSGFNWIRVWANWNGFDADAAAVDAEGRSIASRLEKLKWLVGECDRRGIVVDVSLSRGNGGTGPVRLQTLEAHRRAVETLVVALKPWRNWYLDLSNERNVRDKRFTSMEDLNQLRELAHRLDPALLVTASDGGDIGKDALREYLQTANVDFIAPHRPRDAQSAGRTEPKTREYLAWMKELGRVVPVHYQEPFRRGYSKWNPTAADFVADLTGAIRGGAAGWCFHNGSERDGPGNEPRRSFDLREKRLFDQLDAEERKAISELAPINSRPSSAAFPASRPFSIQHEQQSAWLVTPNGERFFSLGVCCVNQGAVRNEFNPANGSYAAWQHYADSNEWVKTTLQRLKSWGFTTIGGWSDFQSLKNSTEKEIAFSPVLHIGSTAGAPWWDMWDPKVTDRMEAVAREQILSLRDDPRLIGYYSDNEMGWWNGILFRMTLEQAATSGQRQRLVKLIRETYSNDWSELLRDFDPAPGVESWDALENHGLLFLRPGGNGIRVERRFLGILAERYYSLVHDIIRKYDRRALILGDRYQSFYYPEVARACAHYVDAVSSNVNAPWNDGTFPRFYLETLYRLSGKPVFIGEFYMCARENRSGNKNDRGIYPVAATQKERAAGFRTTLQALLKIPYVVGADWFQYYDEPTHGRFDGENFNFGLVDIHDRPYQPVTATAASLNLTALKSELARPRADASQGVPPAPRSPLAHFEPTLALKHWDRERGFVPPITEDPLADLYICWSKNAIYLGLYSQDITEDAFYRDKVVRASDRAEWVVSLKGSTNSVRARIGAGLEAIVNEPTVRLVNNSGINGNVRNIAAMELPAKLFARNAFKSGDTIELASTFFTHCRAYGVEWKGRFTLGDKE